VLNSSPVELGLRLPGQWEQFETGGFFQNWHRDYDPSLGRYVQADPLGVEAGQNLYGYVDGDALNARDPEGLQLAREVHEPSAARDAGRRIRRAYDDFRNWRQWGHRTYPGEANSSQRHCTVNCILAGKYGVCSTWAMGVLNEAQGAAMHDLPRLVPTLRGERTPAFQLSDLRANEQGLRNSSRVPGVGNGRVRQCEALCQ
jgi:RHS repeat-associated protein